MLNQHQHSTPAPPEVEVTLNATMLFLDLGKSKKDHIKEDEFVDMLKSFIQGDFFDGAGNKGADGKPLSQENAVSMGLR